jgi:hypothetical protein
MRKRRRRRSEVSEVIGNVIQAIIEIKYFAGHIASMVVDI